MMEAFMGSSDLWGAYSSSAAVQPSSDDDGSSVLAWGDGYYKGSGGEEEKRKLPAASTAGPPSRSTGRGSPGAQLPHRRRTRRRRRRRRRGSHRHEWFFLVSMTQSFFNGADLPGHVFITGAAAWLAGASRRVRQALTFGIQTIVCAPVAGGVVEFGSTDLIYQNPNIMDKVRFLFNHGGGGAATTTTTTTTTTTSWMHDPSTVTADHGDSDPSALWISEPAGGDGKDAAFPFPAPLPKELRFSDELCNLPSGELLNFADEKKTQRAAAAAAAPVSFSSAVLLPSGDSDDEDLEASIREAESRPAARSRCGGGAPPEEARAQTGQRQGGAPQSCRSRASTREKLNQRFYPPSGGPQRVQGTRPPCSETPSPTSTSSDRSCRRSNPTPSP
ncbi:unnamed protein product [Spirodela intermedia]|uniref:Transcription factor n=1 Tax=Spirodela intermedia TaxID=51605 RepID=A0A7I8IIQ3_SPIIN|nr:unnamed protein product [Spirodela intermedia]CAA6657229.1 unnamed protein product [Spirodela intermedia]